MSELKEEFRNAANPTGGDALTMGELEGQVFQILSFVTGESKSAFQGKDTFRWNLADIILEGEDGQECSAFLSGARVGRQLDWAGERGEFPVRVRLIRRGDLNGNPWELEFVDADGEPVEATAGTPKKGRVKLQPSLKEEQDAFLILSRQLREATDSDFVRLVVGIETAKLAPKFLTMDDEGKAFFHWSAIDAATLALVNKRLKDELKAGQNAQAPAESVPFE